jgi:MarR family transcriptional regulator for hemolysin
MEPIGREVGTTAKVLNRAFAQALADRGGSLPTWLVLLSLKQQRHRTQQEIARAVGIEGPTLTRHLDGMEAARLVTRSRDPADRRAMRVELTEVGEAAFQRLREAAVEFDRRLRRGVSQRELDQVRTLLGRLRENAARPPT